MTSHLIIPDCQVKPGVPIDHIEAAARYAVAKKPDVIINLGDFYDMPSLSSYENKGSKYFHGKSYQDDVQSGNYAMKRFMKIINRKQERIKKNKKRAWNPRMIFTMGNHENRINRAVHNDPVLEGTISTKDLHLKGWEVYDYMDIVEVDGIVYSHCFANPESLKKSIVTGTIENKLKLIGQSFTMGHQQKRQFGTKYTATGKELMGLVAGRFYAHDEAYMGSQGQSDWSGIIMKHEVNNGRYDPSFISMDYLLKHYGGVL